jgi:hypothetical protein
VKDGQEEEKESLFSSRTQFQSYLSLLYSFIKNIPKNTGDMLKNVYSCFYISSSETVFFLKVPRYEAAASNCSIVDIRDLYVVSGCNYN